MFFSISEIKDGNFPNSYEFGKIIVSTDDGWKIIRNKDKTILYKGYCDNLLIEHNLERSDLKRFTGSFCVLTYDHESGDIDVATDLYRGFLMWHSKSKYVSNLYNVGYPIWVDSDIIVSQSLNITETKKDLIGSFDTATLQTNALIDWIYDRLLEKTREFVSNNRLPIKVFLSGGVDSMLVYSFIKQATDDYELLFCNHIDYDHFWCNNHHRLQSQFWGYKQIHHYTKPCVLASGAPGDEFMFRNPEMSYWWLKYNKINLFDVLENDSLYSQSEYFKKKISKEKLDNQFETYGFEDMNQIEFNTFLCNMVLNDAQHWHIGNTITFTPLRDLEMFKKFLLLSPEDAIRQIVGSEISLKMIEHNDSDLLEYLSNEKNTGNVRSNIYKLISKISQSSGQ